MKSTKYGALLCLERKEDEQLNEKTAKIKFYCVIVLFKFYCFLTTTH